MIVHFELERIRKKMVVAHLNYYSGNSWKDFSETTELFGQDFGCSARR
jgi:hypothetical protein